MSDHFKLLGDEVEATKWIGYARKQGNGSLTSPAPGVVVRANQVGSMSLFTITAEGGYIVYVIGTRPGAFDLSKPIVLRLSKTGNEFLIEPIPSAISLDDLKYSIIYRNLVMSFVGVSPWTGRLPGIWTDDWYFISSLYTAGYYIELRDSASVAQYLFFVGDQGYGDASGDVILLVTAAGVYKGVVYLIAYYQSPNYFYPAPVVFAGVATGSTTPQITTLPLPPAQHKLYEVSISDNTPRATYQSAHVGGNTIGVGPDFFAVYEWGTNNSLRLFDFPTGNVLYSWTPDAEQVSMLSNLTYLDGKPIALTVSSRYISAVTEETRDPGNNQIVTSSHLFLWEVTESGLKLVASPQIATKINPRAVSFDMEAAYKGIL